VNWITKWGGRPQLDADAEAWLRGKADLPVQTRQEGGYRHIHRTRVIYRDALGNVTHSVEQIDEDGYEEYSDMWGK